MNNSGTISWVEFVSLFFDPEEDQNQKEVEDVFGDDARQRSHTQFRMTMRPSSLGSMKSMVTAPTGYTEDDMTPGISECHNQINFGHHLPTITDEANTPEHDGPKSGKDEPELCVSITGSADEDKEDVHIFDPELDHLPVPGRWSSTEPQNSMDQHQGQSLRRLQSNRITSVHQADHSQQQLDILNSQIDQLRENQVCKPRGSRVEGHKLTLHPYNRKFYYRAKSSSAISLQSWFLTMNWMGHPAPESTKKAARWK